MKQKSTAIILISLYCGDIFFSFIGAVLITAPVILIKKVVKTFRNALTINDSGIHPEWNNQPAPLVSGDWLTPWGKEL